MTRRGANAAKAADIGEGHLRRKAAGTIVYPANRQRKGGVNVDIKVFVIGYTGAALMPTTPRKARILLASGRAKVFCKRPFTIKLLYKTGSAKQPLTVGVDTGTQHIGIGICVTDGNHAKAIYSAEIELRSTMKKRKLMETRKEYRRGRRYRKTRYRKPRFRYHTKRVYSEKPVKRKSTKHMTHWVKKPTAFDTKPEGWLPPSVESKVQHHIDWINRYLAVLPEGTKLNIELGRFDMARMKDPTINGELYQRGPLYDQENIKAFVFARDDYRCKCCGAKAGTMRKDGKRVVLIAHHVLMKSKGATDNPEHLASVCDACHTSRNHKPGGILYKWFEEKKNFGRGLRDATMMNIVRKRLYKAFSGAKFTYGNITAADRKRFIIRKGHAADAIVIAANDKDSLDCVAVPIMHYKQVRSKKRSLHEANPRKGRKEKNHGASRNSKNTRRSRGFTIYDRVLVDSKKGWISGFANEGYTAYVVDKNGDYIQTGKANSIRPALSSIRKLYSNNGWVLWCEGTMCALSSPT